MILSEAGESRINGYLFVLERSLQTRLPRNITHDAVREIESHIRARVAALSASADERAALEQILQQLGTPLRVAQAYSAERTVDEALETGRLIPMARALGQIAMTTVLGCLAALGLISGYVCGAALLAIGLLKPIFPDHVGLWVVNGPGSMPTSLGIKLDPTEPPAGGNWVILIGLVFGVVLLGLTHRGAKAFLAWWKARRPRIEKLYA